MVRRFVSAFISLLFLLVAVNPIAAQVITNDPNTSGNETPKVEQADARLLQPVTCQAGYKRLHDIADELTRLTGVAVRSGSNNDDWHVRDIPLVVCVKDMPLGRLLKMVAAAAHVQLASETVGKEDPTPIYKFIRTRDGEKELSDPTAAKIEANRKLASWAWDAMAAYGRMPDAPLEIDPEFYNKTPDLRDVNGNPFQPEYDKLQRKELGLEPEPIKLVARVVATLAPETKAKVFSGEQVSIKTSEAPNREALRQLFTYACGTTGGPQPTEDETSNSLLVIKLGQCRDRDTDSGLSFLLYGVPVEMDNVRFPYTWEGHPTPQARALMYAKGPKLPPMPDVDKTLRDEDNPPNPGLELIVSRKDYEHPALQGKVKLDLPKRDKRYSYAEVLTTLAKAGSFDIICEDFDSHNVKPTYVAEDFGEEPTFGSTLERAGRWPSTRWYLDKDSRLLVGYAREWREHHANLVPQKMLDDLHKKLEGSGAQLDDMTPLVQLNGKQVQEWIASTAEAYSFCVDLFGDGCAVWRLYDALGADDRKLAKSEAGLPLAKFDSEWLSKFFVDMKKESEKNIIHLSQNTGEKTRLSDPELVKRLVMRVQSEPIEEWRLTYPNETGYSSDGQTVRPQELGIKKVSYTIVLTGEYKGEQIELTEPWSAAYFPRFTPEKELKLCREAQEKAKKKE